MPESWATGPCVEHNLPVSDPVESLKSFLSGASDLVEIGYIQRNCWKKIRFPYVFPQHIPQWHMVPKPLFLVGWPELSFLKVLEWGCFQEAGDEISGRLWPRQLVGGCPQGLVPGPCYCVWSWIMYRESEVVSTTASVSKNDLFLPSGSLGAGNQGRGSI